MSSKVPSLRRGPLRAIARFGGAYCRVCFRRRMLWIMELLPLLFAPAKTLIGARSMSVLPRKDLKFSIDQRLSNSTSLKREISERCLVYPSRQVYGRNVVIQIVTKRSRSKHLGTWSLQFFVRL